MTISKIEIFVKIRNFRQKSKFWSKIEILVKIRNFRQKLFEIKKILSGKCPKTKNS